MKASRRRRTPCRRARARGVADPGRMRRRTRRRDGHGRSRWRSRSSRNAPRRTGRARTHPSSALASETRRPWSVVQAECGHERLLGNLDAPALLHALLPLLLAVEELALARDVAAVALGDDVLALRLHRLAGDDAPADRSLDRHVEQLARDELAQLLRHAPPVVVRLVAMDDGRERVGRDPVQEDVDLREVRAVIASRLVVEAGVTLGARLDLVEE